MSKRTLTVTQKRSCQRHAKSDYTVIFETVCGFCHFPNIAKEKYNSLTKNNPYQKKNQKKDKKGKIRPTTNVLSINQVDNYLSMVAEKDLKSCVIFYIQIFTAGRQSF